MKPLADCLLYTFIDTTYLRGRPPETVARQLIEGGSDLVQLRAKDLPPAEVRSLAEQLWPIFEHSGVGLVINDYPEIAMEVGAPYCHLGQEDFFDTGHNKTAEVGRGGRGGLSPKPGLAIGLSSHAPEQAERAVRAGAAYVAIGPVFATGTKPQARPVTLEYVRWATAHVAIPWFAIGGINLGNLEDVLAAGARRVCVVSAVLLATNPLEACQQFKERLLSAGRDRCAQSKLSKNR
jgi:thiamine-phosphate pyrophosphorylase